jgi:hypothetical protein
MLSRFEDSGRAVWYLCLGFREKYLNEQVYLFWRPPGPHTERTMIVDVRDMEAPLTIACRKFHQAAVVYLDDKGRPFGAIQCRCPPNAHPPCPCETPHHDDRPIVCCALCEKGKPIGEAEKQVILQTCLEIMRKDRVERQSILHQHRHQSDVRQHRHR